MHRGFTLLELIASVFILCLLLAIAVPNFNGVLQANKMQRLARELHGFVIQAKSESILRRQRLWAHIIMSGASNSQGEWKIELTDSNTPYIGMILATFSGKPYAGLTVTPQYPSQQISFDDIHGRPSNGHIRFHPIEDSSKELKVLSFNRSARFRVCSNHPTKQFFGYVSC
ncbi:pilus assembly FimT family protein [Vibrio rotiferianus]|jgi:type IV fimbrial biogenesis protein FimT|uniref:pilus assembly FimT family protein n=1 Tax=Vibrio TaxID=662 RepID=UPI003F8544A1